MRQENYQSVYDSLIETLSNLTKRIEVLEYENTETTNRLYELENKIDTKEF